MEAEDQPISSSRAVLIVQRLIYVDVICRLILILTETHKTCYLIRLQLLLGEGRLFVAHRVRRILPSQSCIPLEDSTTSTLQVALRPGGGVSRGPALHLHPAPRVMLVQLEAAKRKI